MSQADFEELLAVLDLKQIADDTFIGSHPSKNPVRTFGAVNRHFEILHAPHHFVQQSRLRSIGRPEGLLHGLEGEAAFQRHRQDRGGQRREPFLFPDRHRRRVQ